jgi:hypothetical protein
VVCKKVVIYREVLDDQQDKIGWCSGVFADGGDTVEFMSEKCAELLIQLHGMQAMELLPPPSAAVPSEELPGDTLHFLNPEALKSTDEGVIDVSPVPRSRSK